MPEAILSAAPAPGRVVARRALPALGATELLLSNGMRVVGVGVDAAADAAR